MKNHGQIIASCRNYEADPTREWVQYEDGTMIPSLTERYSLIERGKRRRKRAQRIGWIRSWLPS